MRLSMMLASGAAALVFMAGALPARDLQFSDFVPPTYPMAKGHIDWADAIRDASGGELDWEIFTAGALLPATGTMAGIAAGVVHAGQIAPPYQPSELPVANFVGDLGWLLPDDLVLAAAYADYAVNDPVQSEEYRRNGVVFGAATVSTPVYHLICREQVSTLEDLDGLRARVPGGGWARFAEAIGIVTVSLPASELYTAMERGAVDCAAGDLSQLVGFNLIELAGSVITLPLSPAFAAAWIAYNPDFWASLTPEERRLTLDKTATAMAHTYVLFSQTVEEGRAAAIEKGIPLNDPDAALQAAYAEWVEGGIGGLDDIGRDLGISDPEAITAAFRPYLDKWAGLFEGVDRGDATAIAAVLKANLHDAIDKTSYGLE